MASEKESSKHQEIPLEEIRQQREVAQEQSMNTLLSAQERYHNATTSDSSRDSIYDAIADAKRQISEKDKIPFNGKVGGDPQEDNTTGDARKEKQEGEQENTSRNVLSSLGETISSGLNSVKDAVGGTGDSKADE